MWKDSVNNKAKQRYTAPRYGEKKGREKEKNPITTKIKIKISTWICPYLKPHTF